MSAELLEAIKKVFCDNELESMHYKDVTTQIIKKKYHAVGGSTPHNTVNACFSKNLKSSNPIFKRHGKGLYSLINDQKINAKHKEINEQRKPKIFIASPSTERARSIIREIMSAHEDEANFFPWWNVLTTGKIIISALIDEFKKFDLGIFLYQPDHKAIKNNVITDSVSDNVIFEYGLFVATHSLEKAIILRPKDDMKLLSDIDGVIYAAYNGSKDKKAIVNAISSKIEDFIRQDKKHL